MEELKYQLLQGCEQLSLSLSEKTIQQIIQYVQLLYKWNKAYNLTAVREMQDMLIQHVLDSLVLLPLLDSNAENFLDVGSGGGVPGVLLAICLPLLQITCLDANSKKTRFIQQVKLELNLSNLQIIHERVEKHQTDEPYCNIISRAFSSIQSFCSLSQHLLADNGMFWAMKGKYPESELKELSADFEVIESIKLDVPGLNAERHLLKLVKAAKHKEG